MRHAIEQGWQVQVSTLLPIQHRLDQILPAPATERSSGVSALLMTSDRRRYAAALGSP
jgi:hypothetical protein